MMNGVQRSEETIDVYRQYPIIQSRLDLDYYKLTMGQFIWRRRQEFKADVHVEFRFKNRTRDVDLSQFIDIEQLRDEVDHLSKLFVTGEEFAYLTSGSPNLPVALHQNYLRHRISNPIPKVTVEPAAKDFDIAVEGNWLDVTDAETMVLAIVNELYARKVREVNPEEIPWQVGEARLREKIKTIKALKEKKGIDLKFVEFGTRRRHSGAWQRRVVSILREELPGQFMGTSNVLLGKEFGLPTRGTMAHELFMVLARLHKDMATGKSDTEQSIRLSPIEILVRWEYEFGKELTIALPDTFGTSAFLQDVPRQIARNWNGFRQDSGDPTHFGEKVLRFYESHRIDPLTKTVMFSDGLDVATMVELHKKFAQRIGVVFAWGTNLTNDVGTRPLSLVMKASKANDLATVKLSDNPEKASGPVDQVARFMKIFGYDTDSPRVPCVY